jgi:hypothetical protein
MGLEIVSHDILSNEVVVSQIICVEMIKLISDDNVNHVKKNEQNQMSLILDVFVIRI